MFDVKEEKKERNVNNSEKKSTPVDQSCRSTRTGQNSKITHPHNINKESTKSFCAVDPLSSFVQVGDRAFRWFPAPRTSQQLLALINI